MDYEKAWKDLRIILDNLEKMSPKGPDGTASSMKKLMDKLETEQRNKATAKDIK